MQHVVDLGMHGVDLGLESALLRAGLGVDAVHGRAGQARLRQLGLGLLLAAVGRVQEGAGLDKKIHQILDITVWQIFY